MKKNKKKLLPKMSVEETLEFLENFRLVLADSSQQTKLISIKIPESMLITFKRMCEAKNLKYQTQIKTLMKDWILNNSK